MAKNAPKPAPTAQASPPATTTKPKPGVVFTDFASI